jgi:outer membrane cobalamin receptor
MAPSTIPYPDRGQGISFFAQPGSPRVTLPGYTTIGLSGSYAVFANVWHMGSPRSQRSQMKIDSLLDADYEQVLGFSQPGIRVRGGVTVSF